jgi:hypothetical protein
MAFKKLVSGFVKQKISSNLINGLNNAVGGFGQPKKLAAKLANKSPLDLSKSPSAHMEPVNNPFSYGNVYYPEETSNLGEGHYIIFDVIEHRDSTQKLPNGVIYPGSLGRVGERKFNKEKRLQKLISQGFQTEKKLLRENSSGTQATTKTFHENISDSIILYTPSTNTKFNYSVGYENIDTGLAKQIRGLFDGGDILKKLGDTGGTFTRTIIEAGMNIALPGFGGLVQKEFGTAINPNTEMVFTGVPFRSFSYPFEFAPKSKQEQDSVQKIINLFKFHMMPERKGGGDGKLIVPSEFQITYMYRDGANMYIPKISRCVLKDMNLDYSPEGVFTTFKADKYGAHPTITKMDLTFMETQIMTKETIAQGH